MQLGWDQDTYIKAYRYAAEAHNGQKMPGTDLPYIMHVSLVSMEVLAALQADPGLDRDLALQCALLHDVMEDTGKTYTEINRLFGEMVAQGVSALSKNKEIPDKTIRMRDSLNRIQQQPREIWVVKLADRITNLQPPPKEWTTPKKEEYRKEAIEIYNTLHNASKLLADRLLMKIDRYKIYIQ
jgi:(p)ppGpp synthase/HD superfamily hydrolase